jgi:AraC-like DNA-binding protein
MLGFAGWYDNLPYRDILFYVPFLHLFFIGPIIFFYVQSLLNPSFQFSKKEFFHLIPGILYLTYCLVIFVTDKIILKEYYFYANGSDKDFALWYQISGLISMLCYFIASLKYYKLYKKLIFQVTSYANQILFNWIKTFLYAFLSMLILRIIFYIIPFFIENTTDYTGIWWHYLLFSIILYYIAITGYSNPILTSIPYQVTLLERKPVFQLNQSNHNNDLIEIDFEIIPNELNLEIKVWKEKIELLILNETLYKNPELTILDIAKKLETNVNIISKSINQGFQMNFNDFINNFRIEALKQSLDNNEHQNSTLLGIAYDCGFNSKATFNRAFKKNTGLTPKEYIEKIK